jgi:Protein of unknown function (DUF2794)
VANGEPIQLQARLKARAQAQQSAPSGPAISGQAFSGQAQVAFNRQELSAILNVYGRMVAGGEWRDYAMDFGRETAAFSVFRRASEVPLYRIEKTPKLARKQGAYCVVNAAGLILKRGHELPRVLDIFDKRAIGVVG